MTNTKEAPTETEILFWAQAPVVVNFPTCPECKNGKIHDIRGNKVIVHCRGEVCITSRESIKSMWERNKGGSTG